MFPLRVAQVIASGGFGGRERVPVDLTDALREKNVETELWADPSFTAYREAARRGLPVFPFSHRRTLSWGSVRRLRRLIRDRRPHVLHLHHSKDLWAMAPALALEDPDRRVALFLTKHVGSRVKKNDFLHRWLYRRLDGVLGNSRFMRENLLETCPLEEERVWVVPPPVDGAKMRFSPKKRAELRKKWKTGGRTVVGIAARITPGKGFEVLLETAARLKGRPFLFCVAGGVEISEAGYAETLRERSRRLGLDAVWCWEGFVEDMSAFWSAVDIAAHAAAAETFGLAVVEALACARRLVVRDSPGARDIFEALGSSSFALKLDSDDPHEWAEALVALSRLPPPRGSAVRRKIRSFFLEEVAARHLALYRGALKNKGFPF